jgi:transcriptional regulator GlxA family with amidase domain
MNYRREFSYDSDANERSTESHGAHRMDTPFPQLVADLYAVLRGPQTTPEERIRQAEAILSAFPGLQSEDDRRLDRTENECVERGGLAPWQIRRVKEYVEQGLAERLTGADLARRVKLSEHHFCRAFRISLRQTPHTYVIGRRIERARQMMMSCEWTIGQIAVECGFSDQAHFNRCFRKLIGTSPGVWRRAITAKASG